MFPKGFICSFSDATVGESSYALNANLIGKNLAHVSPDTVLLFETNSGTGSGERDGRISERGFWQTKSYGRPNRKVFKNRWNQSGGAETVTLDNHGGEGCNVSFVDTHVKWISKENISELKWKPD